MEVLTIYKQLCEFNPYPEQEEIFKHLWAAYTQPIQPLLVKLPCGYGKTEALIVPFLTQALKDEWLISPRLIYVLPTRALCNQIHERITKYAKKIEEISGKKIIVGIEHGMSSLDPLFFADICITTFDQFLYGYARSKIQVGHHIDMPAGAFANSCVVFDEAHLYSPYTHALMKALLDILCGAAIPVVLMTATMPKRLQNSLFEKLRYQLIEFKGNSSPIKRNITWKLVDWELLENGKPSKKLKAELKRYSDRKILIVANRIDVAQQLAIGLKERNPVLLHSRFSITNRAMQERAVLEILDRNVSQKEGIVISTQVCEVGLDISCDLLITECASSDALVQRIGRVARWGGEGRVIIVQPKKSIPYIDKKLGDKGDFVAIARKYLEKNKRLDFTSWKELEKFSNEMHYHVGDVEARNALGQLFEQTLYADATPYSLSARDELYCTIFCVKVEREKEETKFKILGGREDNTFTFKKEKKIELPYSIVRDACMNVPYYWFKKKGKGLKIAPYAYNNKEQRWELGNFDTRNPQPFRIYAIQEVDGDYQINIGFRPKDIPEDEEACLIC